MINNPTKLVDALLERRGLNATTAAREIEARGLGTYSSAQSALVRLKKGNHLRQETAQMLADFFAVDVSAFFSDLAAEAAAKAAGLITGDSLDNITAAPRKRPIPVISWVQAGEFSDIVDLQEAGEIDEWFDGYTTKLSDQAFSLIVEGESMINPDPNGPSFPPGTRIVVEPAQTAMAGNFCVAKNVDAQTATFKKLHYEDGIWYLKPLNPAFPMREIDDPNLRVIGKVVESYLRIRL